MNMPLSAVELERLDRPRLSPDLEAFGGKEFIISGALGCRLQLVQFPEQAQV